MIKYLIVSFYFFICLTCNFSIAASNEQTESKLLTEVKEMNLRDDIVALVELSTKTPHLARNFEKKLTINVSPLNYAEQYLLLLIKANIKQHDQQHKEVISLIEEAKLLRKHIAKTQLGLPLFSYAYLVLAKSYVATRDYDNAYKNKSAFVDNFIDYTDAKSENTVDKLTKKYEVANKKEENLLLTNQNKLKALRIGDVKKEQQSQQKRFILIACTILLFVLLFLRQLKVRKKLLFFAQTDSLTGLLNRSTLFSKGQKLIQASIEQQLELSLIVFEIDHFKLISDELGHSVGDLILVKIAELVNETMRARDVFSRLGENEFAAILPSTDHDQAKAITVRVMEKVTQYNFSEIGVNSNITLSIGFTNIKDTNAEFDDILHAADLAMYQSKAQGGNQMVSYESIAKDQERQ